MHIKDNHLTLSDGSEIMIRVPTIENDLNRLIEFFSNLPRPTRNYLRYDVSNHDLCRTRLEQMDGKDHLRIIAELDGEIVGEGALDREPFGWTRHVGHVRTVIHPEYQGRGIGLVISARLVELGKEAGVERFSTEVLAKHGEMIRRLEKVGFVREAVLKQYAKDVKGHLHDIVVMTNDAGSAWNKLTEKIENMDIQIARMHGGA